jgi:hypothetical protein
VVKEESVTVSDTSGLIIAGIIGAGGAIVTQIISSIVTGKRDTRRFNWEREKQEREWETHERERFLDLKRELYSNFAFQVGNLMGHTHALNYPSDVTQPARVDMEELRKLQWNIDLIAPEELATSVSDSLGDLIAADQTAASDHITHDRKVRDADAAESKWWATYTLLREDLLGSEPQAAPRRRAARAAGRRQRSASAFGRPGRARADPTLHPAADQPGLSAHADRTAHSRLSRPADCAARRPPRLDSLRSLPDDGHAPTLQSY